VRQRYDFCCGYCGVSETSLGAEMTIDHFLPRIHGGDDTLDNLVYCCHACNEFKGDYWQTAPNLRLLHPLLNTVAEHYREQEDGTLEALTQRGANHLQLLHLNRETLIAHRFQKQFYATLELQYQEAQKRIAELEQTTQANQVTIGKEFGFSES
jgi:HNH endonuclease